MRSSDSVYLEGLDFFGDIVERFPPDKWGAPSPCAAWRALDVLGHVGATTTFGIELLSGVTPTWQLPERPGDAVGDDPVGWWRELAARARELVADADVSQVLDSPMGPRSVGEGLAFPAIDLFVHGWDLARSGGMTVDIPPDVGAFTHATIDPLPEEQVRKAFAAPQPAPPGATPTDDLIAWTGRDPRWQPR